jgi:hypothetical protein
VAATARRLGLSNAAVPGWPEVTKSHRLSLCQQVRTVIAFQDPTRRARDQGSVHLAWFCSTCPRAQWPHPCRVRWPGADGTGPTTQNSLCAPVAQHIAYVGRACQHFIHAAVHTTRMTWSVVIKIHQHRQRQVAGVCKMLTKVSCTPKPSCRYPWEAGCKCALPCRPLLGRLGCRCEAAARLTHLKTMPVALQLAHYPDCGHMWANRK